MFPATPPVRDISRTKLKTLAAWIRDELDPLIARDGPEALRSDDVVMLHEMFTMIRHNTSISALDLRSSSIHRAIQAIAGITTPWPSRLCDDCNKIIALWTAKFGPLNLLHPFLYGRGGRLEGVANVNDYTRDSLLKKWSRGGHQQTDPKQTHRAGNLGFRAGDWWISTLFAHHAGIIGVEALDGGTTFDNNDAYALVLKDGSELSTEANCRFSYRMKQSDKGKYRLTAATPGSREPIRILRSHKIGSKWGPRVGIRYDGLYKVAGWSIRTAKATDTQIKVGEIFFDVRFERVDEVPMEDVLRRPTAYEADDYTEYKRLRKLNRAVQAHNLDSGEAPITMDIVGRAAPLIQPSHYLTTPPPSIITTPKLSPDISRKAVFWDPQWDVNPEPISAQSDTISPGTLLEPNSFDLMPKAKSSISAATMYHAQPEKRTTLFTPSGPSATSIETSITTSPIAALSNASSILTGASAPKSMKEVTPWVEYDPGINTPTEYKPTIVRKDLSRKTSIKSATKTSGIASSSQQMNSSRHVSRQSTSRSGDMGLLQPEPSTTSTLHRHKQPNQEYTVRRNHNPMAKLFDGPAFDEGAEDYFGNAVYVPNTDSVGFLSPSRRRGRRSVSLSRNLRTQSPTPIKPLSPESPEKLKKRKVITKNRDNLTCKGIPSHRTPMVVPTLASLELNERNSYSETGEKPFVVAPGDIEGSTKYSMSAKDKAIEGKEIKIAFSDPFPCKTPASPPRRGRGRRKHSSGVAPDEIV